MQSTDFASKGVPDSLLLVDDDTMLAEALQRLLIREGLSVDLALDGAAALRAMRQRRYDVVLLDLCMQTLDGMEVLRTIRADARAPATILHTSYADVPTTVAAMREGASDVLQKPVEAKVLAERIRELAAKRRALLAVSLPESSDAPESPALELLAGESAAVCSLRDRVRRVAKFGKVSVLIEGPTGAGKELVARAIHDLACPGAPFVTINCAAVPESLFESEIFGYEAGAFTGARSGRRGLLEEAGNGTVFLDEVGEMPLSVQPKLLRALETREARRLGSNRTRRFDCRVIAATNRIIVQELGPAFRHDLYYRLAGFTISVPSLQERASDIPPLATRFLKEFADANRTRSLRFDSGAVEVLMAQPWTGNVRELKLVVENAAIMCSTGQIGANDVVAAIRERSSQTRVPVATESVGPSPRSSVTRSTIDLSPGTLTASLANAEREGILRVYEQSGRNIARAARQLNLPRTTLRDKIRKYSGG